MNIEETPWECHITLYRPRWRVFLICIGLIASHEQSHPITVKLTVTQPHVSHVTTGNDHVISQLSHDQ